MSSGYRAQADRKCKGPIKDSRIRLKMIMGQANRRERGLKRKVERFLRRLVVCFNGISDKVPHLLHRLVSPPLRQSHCLKSEWGQAEREFKVEVEAIGKVRHKNLVGLIGYCAEGLQRLFVYEYVDNGNLEQWLHGDVEPISP
ncbi:hypothetical protein AgCh_025229 [Apium graveolens]